MDKDVKNGRVFRVKYFGATNTRGSRIKIIDQRFRRSKFVARSYKHINGLYDAIDYLSSIGIEIIRKGEFSENEDILISDNFDIMIDKKKDIYNLPNDKVLEVKK